MELRKLKSTKFPAKICSKFYQKVNVTTLKLFHKLVQIEGIFFPSEQGCEKIIRFLRKNIHAFAIFISPNNTFNFIHNCSSIENKEENK